MNLYKKTLLYIEKLYNNEKDKWISGMKNRYYEAESLLDKFKDCFEKEVK